MASASSSAAYAKLHQQQEMTAIRSPGDNIDTRLLVNPPPYVAAASSSSSAYEDSAAASSSSVSAAFSSFSTGAALDDADSSSSSATTTDDAPTVAGLIILDKEAPGPNEVTITLMRLGGTGLGNVQLNV